MKKRIMWLVGMIIGLITIEWLTTLALVQFHPLTYYYTLEGMAVSCAVTAVEFLIIWPIVRYIFNKIEKQIPTDDKERA